MTTTAEKTTATTDTGVVSKKKKGHKFSPWGVVAWLVGLGILLPGVLDGTDGVQARE